MDWPKLVSAASLLGLHCLSKNSSQILSKKSKSHAGAKVAVNMHSFIVLEILPYLSITCKVRSELPLKVTEKLVWCCEIFVW